MNEYLRAFQNIGQSVEQLLTDEHNSLEIKQSSESLSKSLQPCIEELKQSAARLKGLVQVGFDELDRAEDVWNSKPRIAQAPTHEIWEQIGELSGRDVRIRRLGEQCKAEVVKQAKDFWNERVERLRKKWFIDANGLPKKGIGWGEKDGFIKDIRPEFEFIFKKLILLVNKNFILIHRKLKLRKLEVIQDYADFLDIPDAEISQRINLIVDEIENKFSRDTKQFSDSINHFKYTANHALEVLVNKGWGDIFWSEVEKFKNHVLLIIEKAIEEIFDGRMKLANQAVEKAIEFYNDLLNRQERYRQETPEQREAEKAWIDQQRRELEQVLNGIEAILNESAG